MKAKLKNWDLLVHNGVPNCVAIHVWEFWNNGKNKSHIINALSIFQNSQTWNETTFGTSTVNKRISTHRRMISYIILTIYLTCSNCLAKVEEYSSFASISTSLTSCTWIRMQKYTTNTVHTESIAGTRP